MDPHASSPTPPWHALRVLIPRAQVEDARHDYVPHRRTSFEPRDSVNIASHLHKGYIPTIPRRRGGKASGKGRGEGGCAVPGVLP